MKRTASPLNGADHPPTRGFLLPLLLPAGGLALAGCQVADIMPTTPPVGTSGAPIGVSETWVTGPLVLDFFAHFAVNLIAIGIMAYAIYFRRHERNDLLMVFTSFNIGLFLVLTLMTLTQPALGIGFGLFAILSIIRLRSEPFSNTELGYFFVALVLAVINALQVGGAVLNPMNHLFTACLNALAILAVYVMDHPAFRTGYGQHEMVLEAVYEDDDALRRELERRLKSTRITYQVTEVDYVREMTRVTARYHQGAQPARYHLGAQPEVRPLDSPVER